jgi:DNA-binding CsgD family transcriptional regulator
VAAGLTRREREVLRLLADGRSDREIAAALSISPKTVGLHVSHLMAKLGVPSRAAAVAHVHRHGFTETLPPSSEA